MSDLEFVEQSYSHSGNSRIVMSGWILYDGGYTARASRGPKLPKNTAYIIDGILLKVPEMEVMGYLGCEVKTYKWPYSVMLTFKNDSGCLTFLNAFIDETET